MNLNEEQEAYLVAVTKRKDGITAEELYELVESEGKNNPFHSTVFRENNTNAALAYRLTICRHILRSWVRVEIDPETERKIEIRRVLHVNTTPERAAYVRTEQTLRRKETRQQLEKECVSNFISWKRKWTELLGPDFVEKVISDVEQDRAI